MRRYASIYIKIQKEIQILLAYGGKSDWFWGEDCMSVWMDIVFRPNTVEKILIEKEMNGGSYCVGQPWSKKSNS